MLKVINVLADLLFPRRCPVCDEPLVSGRRICRECEHYFKPIKGSVCVKCGKKLNEPDAEYCLDCSRINHLFESGRAVFEYNSISKSIYRFKYGGRRDYADYYGYSMCNILKDIVKNWQPDVIIPVPLHKSKMKKRGYNQSALLAEAFSQYIGIPYVENAVIRSRKTVPMKELSGARRQINLKNAFIIGNFDVKLKTIVIVDDIYTTGSTMDAVTEVLLAAGASKVYFVTLSIGKGM